MHFEQKAHSAYLQPTFTKKWSLAKNEYGDVIEQDMINKVLYPLIDQLKLGAETVFDLVDGYFC
jgi:hypothetical protein